MSPGLQFVDASGALPCTIDWAILDDSLQTGPTPCERTCLARWLFKPRSSPLTFLGDLLKNENAPLDLRSKAGVVEESWSSLRASVPHGQLRTEWVAPGYEPALDPERAFAANAALYPSTG